MSVSSSSLRMLLSSSDERDESVYGVVRPDTEDVGDIDALVVAKRAAKGSSSSKSEFPLSSLLDSEAVEVVVAERERDGEI